MERFVPNLFREVRAFMRGSDRGESIGAGSPLVHLVYLPPCW